MRRKRRELKLLPFYTKGSQHYTEFLNTTVIVDRELKVIPGKQDIECD